MTALNEDPLSRLAERTRHDDPRFARAMALGRPLRPREYRHGLTWLLLAAALALFGLGVALGDGLLIATGLVGAGAAAHRFDPDRRRGTPPFRPSR
ncbi:MULTISPECIES: DUF3040 domain-containing protein [Streptomyces]|uniref:DUF3040 domain-containing protein n=1 Tax=Streptomyces lichenis TaxID=2306967 RepID=A0ABT0IKB6_9ACTN|nr:DUF3040 domain-containing protein [Streptomyces lichenis]MCK8681779.1 DUF3040 domain-containing protein [Streptomyces lichenis]